MIRDAEMRDLPALAEAMVGIQEAHVAAFPTHYRPFEASEAKAYLKDLLGRRDVFLRAAESAGSLAGHVVLVIQDRAKTLFSESERIAMVAQIEVSPESRRMGVGRSLLADCETLAREAGASRVVLDVGSFNQAGYAFFEASGFMVRSSKLERSVS